MRVMFREVSTRMLTTESATPTFTGTCYIYIIIMFLHLPRACKSDNQEVSIHTARVVDMDRGIFCINLPYIYLKLHLNCDAVATDYATNTCQGS